MLLGQRSQPARILGRTAARLSNTAGTPSNSIITHLHHSLAQQQLQRTFHFNSTKSTRTFSSNRNVQSPYWQVQSIKSIHHHHRHFSSLSFLRQHQPSSSNNQLEELQQFSHALRQSLHCYSNSATTTTTTTPDQCFYPHGAMPHIERALTCIDHGQFGQAFHQLHHAMIRCETGVQISRIFNIASHLVKRFVHDGSIDLLHHFHIDEWNSVPLDISSSFLSSSSNSSSTEPPTSETATTTRQQQQQQQAELTVDEAIAILTKYRIEMASGGDSDSLVNNEKLIDGGLRTLYRMYYHHRDNGNDDGDGGDLMLWRNVSSISVLLRGIMSRAQGSESFAQKYCDQSLELINDLVVAYVVRGESYVDDGLSDRGIADLSRAVQLDDRNPFSYQRRGHIYSRLDQPGAEYDLNRSIELYGLDPTSYLFRGMVYSSKTASSSLSVDEEGISGSSSGQPTIDDDKYSELALSDFNRAISLNPTNVELYYERALFFSRNRQLDRALNDIQTIHSIDTEHTDGYYLRAAIEKQQQNYYSALKTIDRIISIDPDYPLIYEMRGRIHYDHMNNVDAAERDFRTAISKNSVTFQSPVYLGKILSETDTESAIQLFTQAIKLEPEDPIAYTLRAYLHLSNTEDGQAALEDYDQAIEIRKRRGLPIDPELLIYRASAYTKMEEFDIALEELQGVERMDHLSQRERQLCLMQLGIVYGEMKMTEKSLQYYDACIALDPDHAGVYFSRGLMHRYVGNLDSSIQDITRAIELKGNNFDPVYHFERGLSYLQSGDTQRAIKDFDTAITLEHQFVEAYSQRANAYIQEERYREALLDLDKVIELDEADTWALVRRAEVFIALGQIDEGFDSLNEAIEKTPDDPTFYLSRAKAYANVYQDVRKALVDVNKAIALDNQYAEAFMCRAKLYKTLLHDHNKALSDLNRAISVDPDHSESYYERALILRHIGRNDEALDDLNHSIELTPDSSAYAARADLLCSHRRDIDASLKDCERALDYNPNNIEALGLKATILVLHKQQAEEALPLLNHSLSVQPDQVAPYALRALIHLKFIPNKEAYDADMEELGTRVGSPESILDSLVSASEEEIDITEQLAQLRKA